MSWIDFLGFSASLAVLASFCMSTIVPLRVLALASNVLFMSYGFFGHLYPVFLLHSVLLPVNLFKLLQIRTRALESLRSAPELRRSDHSGDARSSDRALSRQRLARSAAVSAIGMAWALGATDAVVRSLAPKSVTAPIAIGLSGQLGGMPT